MIVYFYYFNCFYGNNPGIVFMIDNSLNVSRFLNRACTIRNPEQDLNPDGKASDPWSLCTVDQVEELKALLKVIPLWSTGIMMAVNISQNSFPLLQAASMDRHITSNFEIPAGSQTLLLPSPTQGP